MRIFLVVFTHCEGELNINSRCVKQLRYNTNGQERLQQYDEYSHPKTWVGGQWSVQSIIMTMRVQYKKLFSFMAIKADLGEAVLSASCNEQSSHLGEFRWNLQHHEQQSTKYSSRPIFHSQKSMNIFQLQFSFLPQCLKITQIVSFKFFNTSQIDHFWRFN